MHAAHLKARWTYLVLLKVKMARRQQLCYINEDWNSIYKEHILTHSLSQNGFI